MENAAQLRLLGLDLARQLDALRANGSRAELLFLFLSLSFYHLLVVPLRKIAVEHELSLSRESLGRGVLLLLLLESALFLDPPLSFHLGKRLLSLRAHLTPSTAVMKGNVQGPPDVTIA